MQPRGARGFPVFVTAKAFIGAAVFVLRKDVFVVQAEAGLDVEVQDARVPPHDIVAAFGFVKTGFDGTLVRAIML